MKLSHVTIHNYRSIKHLDIKFDPQCRILVGINESGKTNILQALNLLDPTAVTTRRDVREAGLHEAEITDAYVRFVFNPSDDEIAQLVEHLKSTILSRTYSSQIIRLKENRYTLAEFARSRQFLYKVDILKGTKQATFWSLDDAEILEGWKKVAASCPADLQVVTGQNATPGPVLLKNFKLVDTAEFKDIAIEVLEAPEASDLYDSATSFQTQKTTSNLLKILLWDYNDAKLLPPRVNLDQFCANPDTCLPLKRMFQLNGIHKIKKQIDEAKAGSANSLTNLLRRVAERTSQHFHETWREYDRIQFELAIDGPDLVPRVVDESNRYEFSQRSDGFKRFVTFLLLVSAVDESNLLQDILLLIDEPEIGLHPSGARYLRDELIQISKNNYVVFSTHSIFMVDNNLIGRHLIVKKDKEITNIEEVSESNIQDEEVIFKSLGYSIFSNLKAKNLIFEGWRDKKLFDTAIAGPLPEGTNLTQLNDVGRCFSQGVKQIKNMMPLFEAGDRKCLILSDSDAVAREHQKEHQQSRTYGLWKRYDEVLDGCAAVTGEDFITEASFRDHLNTVAQKFGIPHLQAAALSDPGGKVKAIRDWLAENNVGKPERDATIQELKDNLFDNLQGADIKTEYYDYLRAIVPLLPTL